MQLRFSLMLALKDHLHQFHINQMQAAKLLGVSQPRISDLMRGKIGSFSLQTLIKMAMTAGLQVDVEISNRSDPFKMDLLALQSMVRMASHAGLQVEMKVTPKVAPPFLREDRFSRLVP